MKKSPVLMLVLAVLILTGVAVGGYFISSSGATTDATDSPAAAVIQEDSNTISTTMSYDNAVFGNGPADPRSLGDPNAPIKIQEFASLSCGHCASFHRDVFPALKEKYIDTGKVFFTYVDFPLNAPALEGTLISRCMPNARYFPFLSMLFSTQANWAFDQNYRELLRQNARLAGMSDNDFDACIANDDLKAKIVETMQAKQQAHGINSTPSFVINDKKVLNGAVPLAAFEQAFGELENETAE